MSLPPLRQPKLLNNDILKKKVITKDSAIPLVIVSLKTDEKLVIPSDSYHGILKTENSYRCVFCEYTFGLDPLNKERHIHSRQHHQMLESFPHKEEFAENLLRQINKDNFYCTICNVMVTQYNTGRHLRTETHIEQLNKAINRADIYQPVN